MSFIVPDHVVDRGRYVTVGGMIYSCSVEGHWGEWMLLVVRSSDRAGGLMSF